MKQSIIIPLSLATLFSFGPLLADPATNLDNNTVQLCKELISQNNATKARIALRAATNAAMKPGTPETKRKAHTMALLSALKGKASNNIKLTILMEIQLVAGEEAIDPLSVFLKDEALFKPTARALVNINHSKANSKIQKAFGEALLSAKENQQLTYLKGIASVGSSDNAVLQKVTSLSESKTADIKIASLEALAKIASPISLNTLNNALSKSEGYIRGKVFSITYNYLRNLAQKDKATALKECDKLIAKAKSMKKTGSSFLIGGYAAIFDIDPTGSFDTLFKELKNEDIKIRTGVSRLLAFKPNKEVNAKLIKLLTTSDKVTQETIFDILVRTDKAAVTPYIVKALSDNDEKFKAKAISHLSKLEESSYVPSLVQEFIIKGDSTQWALAFPLLSKVRDNKHLDSVVATYEKINSNELKIYILKLIEKRGLKKHFAIVNKAYKSDDSKIKKQALKSFVKATDVSNIKEAAVLMFAVSKSSDKRKFQLAIVNAINNNMTDGDKGIMAVTEILSSAKENNQPALLDILGRTGKEKTLQLVASYGSKKHSEDIQKEAAKALSKSENYVAAKYFLDILENSSSDIAKSLAIAGLVANITNNKKKGQANANELLHKALKHAPRQQDKDKINNLLK